MLALSLVQTEHELLEFQWRRQQYRTAGHRTAGHQMQWVRSIRIGPSMESMMQYGKKEKMSIFFSRVTHTANGDGGVSFASFPQIASRTRRTWRRPEAPQR
jgi:hypothetical protein